MRKLTEFIFFKNTPLTDFQNTIHFKSNLIRDNYFIYGNKFPTIKFTNIMFNFVKDRTSLKINYNYSELDGVNYCTFKSEMDNIRYYAYVNNIEYISNGCCRVNMLIDPVMTFTQGTVLNSVRNINVKRQHILKSMYDNYQEILTTNNDVLKMNTKKYVHQVLYKLEDFYVIFTCSADLTSDFGSVNNPKLETSDGTIYDRITSPLNIYVTPLYEYNNLMKVLSKYPWITQNVRKVLMLPSNFIDIGDLKKVSLKNDTFNELYTFKKDGRSAWMGEPIPEFSFTIEQLCDMVNLDYKTERHLLRSEYVTIEFYSWDGQQMNLDPAFIDERTGLKIRMLLCVGYHNEIAFFPEDYMSNTYSEENISDDTGIKMWRGSFLNNSIVFNNFDELPVLIDNYNLSLANNANQRELSESKLITNRIQDTFNPKADLKDRFYNVVSLTSNLSPSNLLGKFNDEYEFYRTQKAQNADLALSTPTITNQTNSNSFQIANDFWGITMKVSRPNLTELSKAKTYYQAFGYEWNRDFTQLLNVESMTIANYVQFDGQWILPNVDTNLMEMLKVQFANGVRLWHYNGETNPMNNSIASNEMR